MDNVLTDSLAGEHTDIKTLRTKEDGSIKFILRHYTTDEDGDVVSEELETVTFQQGADVSAYSANVQLACEMAWA